MPYNYVIKHIFNNRYTADLQPIINLKLKNVNKPENIL